MTKRTSKEIDKVNKSSQQILVIDDDSQIGKFIATVAQNMDISCTLTTNVTDFMAALNSEFAVIFIDLIIPGIDGVELLRKLHQQGCENKIALMSGVDQQTLNTAEDLAKALGLTVIGKLQKPFQLNELEMVLNSSATINTVTPHVRQQPLPITEDELNYALKHDEFVLHYQPKVDIKTNRMVGIEALVRWQHPTQGLIFPDTFISHAESLGLINHLGLIIAKKAMNDFKEITLSSGFKTKLSINVSPYSLQDLKLPDKLLALSQEFDVEPERIILEITETGLFKDLGNALEILTRLRMKGMQLSVDDFGTGYSTMQQLQRLPAQELKIDKSFIQAISTNDKLQILVRKIIEMGHELGMMVIAEGVETAEQLEFLRVNHCDLAQGYLFSRPLPMQELLDWIKTIYHAN